MMAYRVVRSSERRVFKIDVGNVPPEDVATYLEQAKNSLKREPVINKSDGRVDLRYNPLSVDEDYFIPVRGGDSGTDIQSLAGGQNTSAIEDVQYIQAKLFAALKIPKAYLGYDESIGSKATLAQEDIRFSRAIARIQRTVLAELNKVAMIHLYSHGFSGESLVDFELKLSNPSSIAQQQKLELISTKFDIAAKVPEGMVDRRWVQKHVLGLTNEEIDFVNEGRIEDKLVDSEVEAASAGEEDAAGGGEDLGGGDEGGLFAADTPDGKLLVGNPDDFEDDEDEDEFDVSIDDEDAPIKVDKAVKNVFGDRLKKRKNPLGSSYTQTPDFGSITGVGSTTRSRDTMNQPFDKGYFKNPFAESLNNSIGFETHKPRMSHDIVKTLSSLDNLINNSSNGLLAEDVEEEVYDDIDLDNTGEDQSGTP